MFVVRKWPTNEESKNQSIYNGFDVFETEKEAIRFISDHFHQDWEVYKNNVSQHPALDLVVFEVKDDLVIRTIVPNFKKWIEKKRK